MPDPELTVFTKLNGVLSKRISLNADGTILSDGSECRLSHGSACRVSVPTAAALAELIGSMRPENALALGRLRPTLPDTVQIVSKDRLVENPGAVARTAENLIFESGRPTWVLLNYDSKGMPPEIRAKIEQAGGFWPIICRIVPELEGAPHVLRRSTSSGLYNTDTREWIPGSDGMHAYVLARDGADIPRFIETLHERCWLAGFGWHRFSASGSLLDRSITDASVGRPERLVFEGAPILTPPLGQDQEARRPYV